jgi:CheY-like chemotaxis protein
MKIMENENKPLEILVVEDQQHHQEAAKQLLKEHNVTIVSTYDEATNLLKIPNICDEGLVQPSYDAVLTDMFLTQGEGRCLSPDRQHLASEQMPFGYPIALMACQKGVPYVVIVSDANHHSGPMAYSMDFFSNMFNDVRTILQFGNTRLAIINREIKNSKYLNGNGKIISTRQNVTDATPVKNWKDAIEYVMKGSIFVPGREYTTEYILKEQKELLSKI